MSTDRRRLLTLSGAMLAAMAGCASDEPTDDGTGDDVNGGDDRTGDGNGDELPGFDRDPPTFPGIDPVTEPAIDDDLLAEQVRGNVAFGLALLERLRTDTGDENIFVSPYSVSIALAMTFAGARGETATELAEALRYELEGDALHGAFGSLETEFERRNADGEDVAYATDDENDDDAFGYQLSSANALWPDEGLALAPEFQAVLTDHYGAGEHAVDFAGDPEAARREINDWVDAETEGRIEDLLPEGSVTGATRLVLTNAVYFLAPWLHDFDPSRTEPGTFRSLDGTETALEMMNQQLELSYAEVEGHKLLELPYANDATSMVVILPADGEFEAFEAAFSVDRLAIMLEETFQPQVDVTLPRFDLESEFDLVSTLQELGVERAFGSGADFSGMLEGENGLFVDQIRHKSFVSVDEEGTEAAAATAVGMPVSEPPDRVEFTVDRPFLFYIRDRPTESPLFVGRVVDGETLQAE